MKKILIILSVTLFISLTAAGQDLLFIGENAYPSSKSFFLEGNSGDSHLKMQIAKDENIGLIAVSIFTRGAKFSGKLIIGY